MSLLVDVQQAAAVLRDACQQILTADVTASLTFSEKADGSLLTEIDLRLQQTIIESLQQHWPDVPVMAEEMSAQEHQAFISQTEAYWCLDPIDGTTNLAHGLPYYAVSLALMQNGVCELGVVYDPSRDDSFSATRGGGAFLNQQYRLQCRQDELTLANSIAMIDFKRLSTAQATLLATQPRYRSQRSLGSVALDWCWLAMNRGQVYIHGKQKLWDYGAGVLIFTEAGGIASQINGEPISFSPQTPGSALAAVNASLYKEWQAYLESA